MGFSTIYLASALKDVGAGALITMELIAEKGAVSGPALPWRADASANNTEYNTNARRAKQDFRDTCVVVA
jgi:hypothetical protein